MDAHEAKVHELETAAQRAGEVRLELAHDALDEDYEVDELAGPYCGCLTCDVREVLAAAWPYLKELAILEAEVEGVQLAHGVVPKDD